MSPFPSAGVIHPRWAEHHAPVATGTMNATCRIEHGATGGGWDPDTGATPGVPVVTYTGRCRVQYAATQARDGDAADQATSVRTVLVTLPHGSAAQTAGARVHVTAIDPNGPTALVGRVLTVDAAQPSSLAFEQDLTCTDDQSNQPEA